MPKASRLVAATCLAVTSTSSTIRAEEPSAECRRHALGYWDAALGGRKARDFAAAERNALLSLAISSEPILQAELAAQVIRARRPGALGRAAAAAISCFATDKGFEREAFGVEGAALEIEFEALRDRCRRYRSSAGLKALALILRSPEQCLQKPPSWQVAVHADDEGVPADPRDVEAGRYRSRTLSIVIWPEGSAEPWQPSEQGRGGAGPVVEPADSVPSWIVPATAGTALLAAAGFVLAINEDREAAAQAKLLQNACSNFVCTDTMLRAEIEKGKRHERSRNRYLVAGTALGVVAAGGFVTYLYLANRASSPPETTASGHCSSSGCWFELRAVF